MKNTATSSVSSVMDHQSYPAQVAASYRYLMGTDWRWQLARRRNWEEPVSFNSKDKTIRLLTTLINIELGNDHILETAPEGYLEWANMFRMARAIREDPINGIELELMVLAGFGQTEIAAEMKIAIELVEMYETCFFDIRECLNARDAVMTAAIQLPDAANGKLRSELLRLSYAGGRIVAASCIDYLCHRDDEHDLSTAIGIQRKQIEMLVKSSGSKHEPWIDLDSRPYAAMVRTGQRRVEQPTVAAMLRSRIVLMDVDIPSVMPESTCESPTPESSTDLATDSSEDKKSA